MELFEFKTINELCLKITDGAHFSPSEEQNGIYPMYSSKDMLYNGFDDKGVKMISNTDYDRLVKQDCRPLKDDILIIKDGNNYLKQVFKVKSTLDAVILSSIAILRPNKKIIDPDYFTYVLRANSVRKAMANYVSGAAIPRVVLKDFKKMKLKLLKDINSQSRIASVLSAYDNLIENNNKRIRLLEQMAENLYKEWFVRFRFPGHEKADFENGLPKGWRIVRLSDYADIVMGQSPESEFYNNQKEGLPFHQGVGSYGDFYLKDDVYATKAKKIAEPDSIIFSVRAPVGRINITLNRIILGRGVSSINAKDKTNAYLFWMLKNMFAKEDLIGNGSIFTSVTKEELFKQKITLPNDETRIKFNKIGNDIEKEIRNLSVNNQILNRQRDLLLPRLMSGKLEVNV